MRKKSKKQRKHGKSQFERDKDNALYLWEEQQAKAEKASSLLKECEEIEKEILKIVKNMETYAPELFNQWVEKFGQEKINNESNGIH